MESETIAFIAILFVSTTVGYLFGIEGQLGVIITLLIYFESKL